MPRASAALLASGAIVMSLSACAGRKSAQFSPRNAPLSGVASTFERQVQNAVDAGEGDLEVNSLRTRLAANPDDLAARLALATAYEKQGATELAVDHYRIALDRFPDSGEAAVKLADHMERQDQHLQAIDVLAAYVDRTPRAGHAVLTRLAILCDENGLAERGEKYHRKVIELQPKQDAPRNNLGYSFLLRKFYAEAVHEFRAALQLNSKSVLARNNLAWALAARGAAAQAGAESDNDLREAVLHWQSLQGPAAAHSNLAAVWMERQQYAEARKELNVALGYDSRHPAVLKNLKVVADLDGKAAEGHPEKPGPPVQAGRSGIKAFFAKVLGTGPAGQVDGQSGGMAKNTATR